MSDPLSEIISLLSPQAVFSKVVSGAGAWAVRYSDYGYPSFCTILEGSCRLAIDGQDAVTLQAGDFVLLPTTPAFTISGFEPAEPLLIDPNLSGPGTGEVRHGNQDGPVDVRLLGGCFVFGSPDSRLLTSLLPAMIHIRDAGRLAKLVEFVAEDARREMPGRELVLSRLIDVLLVEALRSMQWEGAPPGLPRGLADPRLAQAIRLMHAEMARPWTMAELSKQAGLSRAAFFDRFSRAVGVPPMEYLSAWRMAIAKDLLRRGEIGIAEVAERVGYGSASTFSTAFSRQVGVPPGAYARSAA